MLRVQRYDEDRDVCSHMKVIAQRCAFALSHARAVFLPVASTASSFAVSTSARMNEIVVLGSCVDLKRSTTLSCQRLIVVRKPRCEGDVWESQDVHWDGEAVDVHNDDQLSALQHVLAHVDEAHTDARNGNGCCIIIEAARLPAHWRCSLAIRNVTVVGISLELLHSILHILTMKLIVLRRLSAFLCITWIISATC